MPLSAAKDAILACCGSHRWSAQIVSLRPFTSPAELFESAETVWWSLDGADWLEAFAKHPRIGAKSKLGAWSSEEQRGMETASPTTSTSVSELNQRYQEKFGWIFIVCATGKTAEEMQGVLESRIQNSPDEELRVAAGEQAKITRLRLSKLFDL